MKTNKLKYSLTEMTDKDYAAMYKANEEFVIPEELKQIIKALADK